MIRALAPAATRTKTRGNDAPSGHATSRTSGASTVVDASTSTTTRTGVRARLSEANASSAPTSRPSSSGGRSQWTVSPLTRGLTTLETTLPASTATTAEGLGPPIAVSTARSDGAAASSSSSSFSRSSGA